MQYKYEHACNLTSIYVAPVFAARPHFRGSEQEVIDGVKMYDAFGN